MVFLTGKDVVPGDENLNLVGKGSMQEEVLLPPLANSLNRFRRQGTLRDRAWTYYKSRRGEGGEEK
jgi:hypothetical protein